MGKTNNFKTLSPKEMRSIMGGNTSSKSQDEEKKKKEQEKYEQRRFANNMIHPKM